MVLDIADGWGMGRGSWEIRTLALGPLLLLGGLHNGLASFEKHIYFHLQLLS